MLQLRKLADGNLLTAALTNSTYVLNPFLTPVGMYPRPNFPMGGQLGEESVLNKNVLQFMIKFYTIKRRVYVVICLFVLSVL